MIKKENIDILVIDHYGMNYNYKKKLKQDDNELKILNIYDIYLKHYCDILLNNKNKVVFSDISIPSILPKHLVQDIDELGNRERIEIMYQVIKKQDNE